MIGPRSCPLHPPQRDFTAFLDPADLAAFEQEFPEAAAWLRFRSLMAEAGHLDKLPARTRRQERRLLSLYQQLADVPLTLTREAS